MPVNNTVGFNELTYSQKKYLTPNKVANKVHPNPYLRDRLYDSFYQKEASAKLAQQSQLAQDLLARSMAT